MGTATGTAPYLRHFKPDEIMISKDQAEVVLNFFWPNKASASALNDQDVEFAQALLLEAIDASYAMGYVQILFESFYMKPFPSAEKVREAAKDFAKKAFKLWFRHATQKDLEDPKIYDSVRARIAVLYRSIWEIRLQTGELTY